MANAKRASMREGPLAALFRKTEEAEQSDQPTASDPQSSAAVEPPARAAAASEPAPRSAPLRRAAAAARDSEPAPPVAPVHPRDSGVPHPR